MRRWLEKELENPEDAQRLQDELGLHPLIARLLVLRGISEIEQAEDFLSPVLKKMPDPSLLKGMDLACERITKAILDEERIVIYGDYDVDGVTSTTLLSLFLKELGVPATHLKYFIPNRVEHGYGLQEVCLPIVKEMGCDLLITVDCGITSRKEVAIAKEMGMETIILDHHLAPLELPEACAILNPHQPDCPYPDKVLAAVGVTFNLVVGLRRYLRERDFFKGSQPALKKYLDIVALGTVADIVPLLGVNRIFVQVGLQQMKQTQWLGLAALMRVSELNFDKLSSYDLGFKLGPRINAAGRLRDASVGVELLTTQDRVVADRLAKELDKENQARRDLEGNIQREAREIILQSSIADGEEFPFAIVVARDTWHVGVVGIVASRLVEEFHRPTVVIAVDKGIGKGSARSIPKFDLYESLKSCSSDLIGFGGHKAAAGLSIEIDNISTFRKHFMDYAKQHITAEQLQPTLYLDMELQPHELTDGLLEAIEELAPFGMSNPSPLFWGKQLQIIKQRIVGSDGKHLQIEFALSQYETIKAIAFGQAKNHPLPEFVDVAYLPQFNYWRNRRTIQLLIKKIYLPN